MSNDVTIMDKKLMVVARQRATASVEADMHVLMDTLEAEQEQGVALSSVAGENLCRLVNQGPLHVCTVLAFVREALVQARANTIHRLLCEQVAAISLDQLTKGQDQ